jgi:hypothetical protein
MFAVGLTVGIATGVQGQIEVGAQGSTLQTFDSAPPTNAWSTLFTFGTSAGYSGSNAAMAMDSGVQRFAASNINEALPTTTASTGGNLRARWNSVGRCLQTQVDGGIDAVMLLGTLTNISPAPILGFELYFDFAIPGAPGPEDIPGHRLYFNVSGAASNWFPIGTIAVAGPQVMSINLSNTAWAAGSAMYLLFMDDNAVTNPEGSYQIDNLVIANVVVPQLHISRGVSTGEISISWTNGVQLQETMILNGTNTIWTNVPGNPNPYTFSPTGVAKYFSLRP